MTLKIKMKQFLPLILASLLGMTLFSHLRPAQAQTSGIIYVDAAATGAATGISWADAFTNVQDALAVVASGDQIWVASGVYYPDEGAGQTDGDRASTFALQSGVEIYGGFAGTETALSQRDPAFNLTVLSGDIDQNDVTTPGGVVTTTANIAGSNAYHVVTGSGADATAVLDGFTITAGKADGSAADGRGAGMYNDSGSPTLTNVTFSGNFAAWYGGGMYNNNSSSPTLTNVTFSGNFAAWYGGGMYNNNSSSPTLTNVTFSANSASTYAGGMFNYSSSPTLTNVVFSDNSAYYGGGMYTASSSANPTLTNVVFSANSAYWGGGMYSYDNSTPTLSNVTFSANSAGHSGGGMINSFYSSPTLTNVTFSANSADSDGGGMFNSISSPTLTNVTFSANSAGSSGGGMYNQNSSNLTLTNVIIANSGSGGDCVNSGAIVAANNSLIEDTGSSACDLSNGVNDNIIGQDPLLGALTDFGGPGREIFPLLTDSPAIDAGTNCAGCPTTDQRGAARPFGSGYDIGAYEAGYSLAIAKQVDDPAPARGQTVTFTVVVTNTGLAVTGGVISDTLPAGLNFLGPITLDDPSGTGTAGSAPPILASGLNLAAGGAVTVTFPVTVSTGLSVGAALTNTAAVTATQITTPTLASVSLAVNNQAPTADAGPGQSVNTNATVTLDGSGSSDPDGDTPLTYGWAQTGGPAVTLSDAAAVMPTFTAPGSPAVLTFTLTVTDSLGLASAPDTVVVTVQGAPASAYVYLPLIMNNFTAAPDLVIADLTVDSGGVTVTIQNVGNTAVTDPFWVDLYLNPDPPPTAVNETWRLLADEGD